MIRQGVVKSETFFRFVLVLVYSLTGIFLLKYLWYYTDSPDTIFYLSISKKYAVGNFYQAINNYWSPLISFLLIPFHLCQIDPLLSFKIVQLLLGGTGLLLTLNLSRSFHIHPWVNKIFGLTLVPVFLSYALLYQTPDLLFLCLLILLISQMVNIKKNNAINCYIRGLLLGLNGAGLYLAKAYGFPFFIASLIFFIIFNLIETKETEVRLRIIRMTVTATLTFFLISLSWMSCLYFKYGTFTTGYASVYNFNLLHPDRYKPGVTSLRHPVLINELMDISSKEEASAWESPGSSHQRSWSPFEGVIYFKHYLHVFQSNVASFYYFIIKRNVGFLFLLMLVLFFILIKNPLSKVSFVVKFVTGLLVIFVGGYSLVFFMPRYLWICFLLLSLISFYLGELIYRENVKFKKFYILFILVSCLLLIKKPVKELLFKSDVSMPTGELAEGILNFNHTLGNSYAQSRALPSLIDKMKVLHLKQGKVAGIASGMPGHYSYTQSLLVAMYCHQTFYGELPKEMNYEEKLLQLKAFGIDYIYCWETDLEIIPNSEIILNDPSTGFKLIKLDK